MLEHHHSPYENSLPDFPSKFLLFCSAGQYLKMRKRKNWGSPNWPAPMIPPPPRWGNTTKTNWEKEILCSLLLTNMWMSTTKGIYILHLSIDNQSQAWYNFFQENARYTWLFALKRASTIILKRKGRRFTQMCKDQRNAIYFIYRIYIILFFIKLINDKSQWYLFSLLSNVVLRGGVGFGNRPPWPLACLLCTATNLEAEIAALFVFCFSCCLFVW